MDENKKKIAICDLRKPLEDAVGLTSSANEHYVNSWRQSATSFALFDVRTPVA